MKNTIAIIALGLAAVAATALQADQDQIVVSETVQIAPGRPLAGGGPGAAPMPMGTGLIMGQAQDAATARPVPGVLVTLSLPGASPLRALADSQGRFAFRDLPKGRYNITISKAGYVDGAIGRLRPSGPTQPVDLADGERLGGLTIPIWKFAAIAGHVTDENSEPVIAAQVRVLRRSIVGGQWRLTPAASDLTDDRGAYRIGALEPGEYVVVVPMSQGGAAIENIVTADGAREVVAFQAVQTVRVAAVAAGGGGNIMIDSGMPGSAVPPPDDNGRPQVYPTQFYPVASTSARAVSVAMQSGDERAGVDFQLTPVRAMRVAGTVTGPDGPTGNMPITLVPAGSGDLSTPIETIRAFSDASGNFSFASVPAGQYTLRATRSPRAGGVSETITMGGGGMVAMRTFTSGPAPLPTDPTLWAEDTVAVGTTDVDDLVVVLRAGLKVTGQVQFDGAAEKPPADRLAALPVMLEPADSLGGSAGNVRGRISPTGQLETMGVPPGRYFVRVPSAPPGWSFHGAMLGGRDVSDVPLEIDGADVGGVMITFTDRPTALSGQVSDPSGKTDAGATVIIFPTDSAAWVGYGSVARRLRNVRVDKNGAYSVENLPVGDYFVAAVPDKMAADWQNPKFLGELAPQATRVRLDPGNKVTQNVQVVR